MTVRAVVFDFDGVLANSEPLHFRAMCDALHTVGVALSEADYYARYLGYDDVGALKALAKDRQLRWTGHEIDALVERKAVRLEALERDRSVLFPGAAAAIRRLTTKCPLAIASGARGEEIRRVLDRESLAACFTAIVAAEDTAASKPAPDPYARAVALLGRAFEQVFNPADCVAVEDSTWGLESACAAGLTTIAITHTYPAAALSAADAIVDSLEALSWEFLTGLHRRHGLARPS